MPPIGGIFFIDITILSDSILSMDENKYKKLLQRINKKAYVELVRLNLYDLGRSREASKQIVGVVEEDLLFGTIEQWRDAFEYFCNQKVNKKGKKVDRCHLKSERFNLIDIRTK